MVFQLANITKHMLQYSYFDRLRSTVYEVAQEQEVGFRRPAGRVEQPKQIVELAVQVADHFDGSPEPEQHGLPEERAPGIRAQGLYAWSIAQARGTQQAVDDVVIGPMTSRRHDAVSVAVYTTVRRCSYCTKIT